MAISKNTPTNPKKGPGKGKVKEKIKKDPKSGREFSVVDKGMGMKKTLTKNAMGMKKTLTKNAKPIYTSNPKDPRIKSYNDSLTAYETQSPYRDIPIEKPVQPVKYKKPVVKKKAVVKKTNPTVKNKATSKPVEKSKPMEKEPRKTMKVDSMTEKQVTERTKSYEAKTGKTYMSKDEGYNKLAKKLGRKPTVKEYNDSLK